MGNGLANYLDGFAGSDILEGRDGNDTIVGSYGNNIVDGGAGHDIVTYLAIPGVTTGGITRGVTFSLAITTAQIVYGGSTDTLINIEGLQGSLEADTLTGNAQSNTILGETGDDSITGDAGADSLAGGDGLDTISGGGGADQFLFTTVAAAGNADQITDFSLANDRLVLDSDFFAVGASVTASELAFGTAASTAQHRLVWNAATGALLYDADGVGAALAVQIATLTSGLDLTSNAFLVI